MKTLPPAATTMGKWILTALFYNLKIRHLIVFIKLIA